MKTGLTKRQKTTTIYFDEDSPMIEVVTYNTDLKKTGWRHLQIGIRKSAN